VNNFYSNLVTFPFSQQVNVRKTGKALTWTIETLKAKWLLYIPHTLILHDTTYFCNVDTFVLLSRRNYITIKFNTVIATFQFITINYTTYLCVYLKIRTACQKGKNSSYDHIVYLFFVRSLAPLQTIFINSIKLYVSWQSSVLDGN
jgi:hypothetical protein